MSSRSVLVVDDERSMREMLDMLLRSEGYEVTLACDGGEAVEILSQKNFDVVLTDLRMPKANGITVLEEAKKVSSATQVILITAHGTHQSASMAMASGAFDYIEKPFDVDEVRFQVVKAIEVHDLILENLRLRGDAGVEYRLGPIVGRSPAMREVFQVLRTVARTRTTVLITGESGTGKELAARALHGLSDRADGPFVVINCGAIPENLLESELFGYTKGAFTGAGQAKPGIVSTAQGGTLFFDEVGELPLHMQVKLLRLLQERTIMPVGGLHEQTVDLRIVAGTNRDMGEHVSQGRFREDLYYRLNVVQVVMPPLRDRQDDVALLAGHFLRRFSGEMGKQIRAMAQETLDALMVYPFPGNVRELENIIQRAVTFETSKTLTADHLPPHVVRGHALGSSSDDTELQLPAEGMDLEETLAGVERDLLCQALRRTRGNQTDAARLLGITFRSIRYKVQKYGLNPDKPEQ
jgi:two-component system, NtrC family, response regulator PilR